MFVEQKILFNFWFRPNNNNVFLARYINFNLNAFTKNKILPRIECTQVRAQGYSRAINTGMEQITPF